MWLRCQIGSKSPLANRKARMFWAASLPRKWSIRKICSSSKTSCSSALSLRAEARSMPNGFSMMIRLRSTRSASSSMVHDRQRGLRAARSGSAAGAARRRRTPPRPRPPSRAAPRRRRAPGAQRSRLENSVPALGVVALAAVLARPPCAANSTNESRSCSSSEVPTTCISGSSPDWNRCSRPGSSLRWARSPVAPKRTTVVGVGMGPACTRGCGRPVRELAGAEVVAADRESTAPVPAVGPDEQN